MAQLIVKAHLASSDGDVETRRFPFPDDIVSSSGLYKIIRKKIGNKFPSLANKTFSLMWKDSDGDFVLMSTEGELRDAMNDLGDSSLHVYIKIEDDANDNMAEAETSVDEASESPSKEKEAKRNYENKKLPPFPPFGFPSGMGMMGIPPPPPPPCPLHFGPWERRHRHGRREDRHHHEREDGHSYEREDGYPYEREDRHHHGMGHWGRMMGHGPLGMHSHFGGGRRGRHHHHHHYGHGRPHGHHHHEHVFDDELLVEVPRAHRQWAKKFIARWRQDNLKNATSTSSDCVTDDDLSTEKAGVPDAYKFWLLSKLPRWHKKWGGQGEGMNDQEKPDKERKKMLKMSVPKDFRLWTNRYLRRHFGPREAPAFRVGCRREMWGHHDGFKSKGMCRRNQSRQIKKKILASLVPANQREWAKNFINEWRAQKGLEDMTSAATTTSESEEGASGLDDEEVPIPPEYEKWLDIFLPRWHSWRGLIEKPVGLEEKGIMLQFKDSVPMTFRGWVKHYLARQFGRQRHGRCMPQDDDIENQKYRKWLQIFKQKWIQSNLSQSDDIEGFSFLNSGDEEEMPMTGQTLDKSEVPEQSFKKLRLSSDEEDDVQAKCVSFHPSTHQQRNERSEMREKESWLQAENNDVDNFEIRHAHRKIPMRQGLRNWVWQELESWDGKDVDSDKASQAPTPNEDIPPHVYQMMFRVMNKVHMKKMKQEQKAAKKEMKATRKLVKAEVKAARRAYRNDFS